MSESQKLTKKQRKALEFRNKKVLMPDGGLENTQKNEAREKDHELKKKSEDKKRSNEELDKEEEPVKKKRKTRRGKKGKGSSSGGNRFLLFVGNLPYDVTEPELVAHFKNANPDKIRIRTSKGIAFLEFSKENTDIQSRMEHALRMHHSLLRDRRINVELTVGGGGNSNTRQQKIKEKNEKLKQERKERIRAELNSDSKKKRMLDASSESAEDGNLQGMHPSRLALIK